MIRLAIVALGAFLFGLYLGARIVIVQERELDKMARPTTMRQKGWQI